MSRPVSGSASLAKAPLAEATAITMKDNKVIVAGNNKGSRFGKLSSVQNEGFAVASEILLEGKIIAMGLSSKSTIVLTQNGGIWSSAKNDELVKKHALNKIKHIECMHDTVFTVHLVGGWQ